MSLYPTRTRLDLLRAVSTGHVYTEANQAWRRPAESIVTSRCLELATDGWIEPLQLEPAGSKRQLVPTVLCPAILIAGQAITTCRSCEALIVWIQGEDGASVPVDVLPDPAGDIRVDRTRTPASVYVVDAGEGTHTSHIATCPGSTVRRRPRQKAVA